MVNLKNGTAFYDDCFKVFPTIKDHTVDLILCDLPYGVTRTSWDNLLDLDLLWKEYWRMLKPDGNIVLFAQHKFSIQLQVSQLDNYKYKWIWVKNSTSNFAQCNHMPLRKYEEILVFNKNKKNYFPQGITKVKEPKKLNLKKDNLKRMDYSRMTESSGLTNFPTDVLYFDRPFDSLKDRHPTQKPTDLLEYLIKTYTKENELVLDNTAGTLSTGVAAINAGREYIVIEKEKHFYDIGVNRLLEAEKKVKARLF